MIQNEKELNRIMREFEAINETKNVILLGKNGKVINIIVDEI